MLRLLVIVTTACALSIGVTRADNGYFGHTSFFDNDTGGEPKHGRISANKIVSSEVEQENHQDSNIPATKNVNKLMNNTQDINVPVNKKGNLYLFTTLDCPTASSAVKFTKEFKKSHPEITVESLLICRTSEIKQLNDQEDLFSEELPITIDLAAENSLSREFAVKEAPTYVFVFGKRAFKVAGQPNLERMYQECLSSL